MLVEDAVIDRLVPQQAAAQLFGNRLVFGQLYNVGVNYGITGKAAQPPAIAGDELFNAPRRLGSSVNALVSTTGWRTIDTVSRRYRCSI
jgi:hypothetical protein